MTDAEKLRTVAKWFDVRDAHTGNTNNDVQKDLLRIAADLDHKHPNDGYDVYAPKESLFNGEFKQDREEVKPMPVTREQYGAILYWLETNVPSGPDNAYAKLEKAFPIVTPPETESQEELWNEACWPILNMSKTTRQAITELQSKFTIHRK